MNYYDENERNNIVKLREQMSNLPYFCRDYFRSIEPRTTSRTRLSYSYDLQIFFKFLRERNPNLKDKNIELSDIDKVKFQDIEEYMEYLKYYREKEKDVLNSDTSIKRKIASLRSFYKYYYNNDLIKHNPAAKVSLPKIREKEIIRLENNEVVDLLNAVEAGNTLTKNEKNFHNKTKLRDVAILTLLLGTGIRVSECVGINLDDVDYENTAIRIKRKGGKEAIVYFSDEVLKPLKEYTKYRLTISNVDSDSVNALFLSMQNKRICVRAVEKLVKKYAKTITPLKHITPHKLRSTFGTNLYRETEDIYLVASVLGHNDVNTTRKHYAALEDDQKRLARNKVKLREEIDEDNK